MMSAVAWTGGGNGTSWTDANNWSTRAVPGPADDVTINLPGAAVTLASGSQSIHSLSVADPLTLAGGTLAVATTVRAASPLTLAGGTLSGGTLSAATAGGTALVLTQSGGTLAGVTVGSATVVDGTGTSAAAGVSTAATVTGGLVLNGTLDLGAASGSYYGRVYFAGSQTLGGVGTVQFGGRASNALYAQGTGTAPATLTVGSGVTVHGQSGTVGGQFAGDSFVLAGTVRADGAGGTVTVIAGVGGTLVDQGTLAASTGGTLAVQSTVTVTGSGAVASSVGGAVTFADGVLGPTTNAVGWAPQGPVTFGGGTAASPVLVEAMSNDIGNSASGLAGNFDYGPVSLAANAYVRLVDRSANVAGAAGPNAVYVTSLYVPTGATLDLNGLHLYAASADVLGTVLNGTVTGIAGQAPDLSPENAAAAAASTGIVAATWNDVNGGGANVTTPYTDQVQLVDVTAGNAVLATATVSHAASVAAPVGKGGGTAPGQAAFNLASYPSFHIGDTLATVVTTDVYDNVFESTKANNQTTVTVTQSPFPDLAVTGLGVTGTSAGQVTVGWTDDDLGAGPVGQSYYDGVTVVDVTTGQNVGFGSVYVPAGSTPIPAGGSAPESFSFALPSGFNVTHLLRATVTADSSSAILETNELNNAATVTTTGPLAQYPDLVVQNLTVSPTAPVTGQSVTVGWADANTGAGPATTGRYDLVQVKNLTTGQTLVSATPYYSDTLAAGGSAARTYTFPLPNGTAGAGQLQVTVTTDYYNNVFEYNAAGTAESNNTATTTVTSTVAAYPDLTVANLTAAASTAGLVTVGWSDSNGGTAPVSAGFTDSVVLTDAKTGQTVATHYVTYPESTAGPIAAGSSVVRSATIQLAQGFPIGDGLSVTVTANYDGEVYEPVTTNNAATASVTTSPPADLSVASLSAAAAADGSVTATWRDADAIGAAPVTAGFTDTVTLTDTKTGQVVTTQSDGYDPTTAGPITAGGSSPARSAVFQLPQGFADFAHLSVTVAVNTDAGVFESDTANDSSTATVVAAAMADLSVAGLTAAASAAGRVTAMWADASAGAPATAGFTDTAVLTDTATGLTVGSQSIAYDPSRSGQIPTGGTSPAITASFQLPQGFTDLSHLSVTVTTDTDDGVYQTNTSNDASNVAVTAAPVADLSVAGLTAAAAATGRVTATWADTAAAGGAAVTTAFADLVVLTDTLTGKAVASQSVAYDPSHAGAIAAGTSSAPIAAVFQLPQGFADLTHLSVAVTTDADDGVFEANTANDVSTVTVTTVPVADLSVSGLSAAENGQGVVSVAWSDADATGAAAITTGFTDAVTLTDTTTRQTLGTYVATYDPTQGVIRPGGTSAVRSATFQLPKSVAGTDALSVTVTADADSAVFETDTADDSATAAVARTALPHLTTSAVSGPTTAAPGQSVTVTWTVTNDGGAAAAGSWTGEVLLATDAAGNGPVALAAQTFTGPLAAGASAARSATVTIPSYLTGDHWFVVDEDADGALFQPSTTANAAVAAVPVSIPTALTLTVAATSVREDAGPTATTAMVSRNTTAGPLTVALATSDPSQVTLPTTVTIPTGQSSVTFTVGVTDDGLALPNQSAALAATATGFTAGSASLTVVNVDVAELAVSVDNATFADNAGAAAAMVTVVRNTPTYAPLVVNLLSSDVDKVTVPATVTIPAGSESTTVPLAAVNDGTIDGPVSVMVTASAPGVAAGAVSLTVTDVNVPTLSLTLAVGSVSEAAGQDATTGTISIPTAPATAVTVNLTSSNTSAATVPATVQIPAGQTSATFPIAAVDDGLVTGNRSATITAAVETDAAVVVTGSQVAVPLTITEHDGPALTVSLAVSGIEANGTTTATVTRNTTVMTPLTVTLASDDTAHATVPTTVTIPAGSRSATFTVAGVDDGAADGTQTATITASATGLAAGSAVVSVGSIDLPNLIVAAVTAPATTYDTAESIPVTWTVTNVGQYPAEGSWTDQVYVGSTLVDTVAYAGGTLAPGASYTQSDTVSLPTNVGQYVVRVVTDPDQFVQELSFDDNAATATAPLSVAADYHATVTTSVTAPVPNGTPIPLTGRATLAATGAAAAHVPVALTIVVAGTTRTLTATTDADGNYTATFTPLPYEAGDYTVAADDPGVSDPSAQAAFTIVGLKADSSPGLLQATPGVSLTGTVIVQNLSGTELTGLTATASGGPADTSVAVTPAATTIAGAGIVSITYSFTPSAADVSARTGAVTIHLATDQGAVLDVPVSLAVVPLAPVLSVNPGTLTAGMVVGTQSLVTFTVTNTGGAPSGSLSIALPSAAYLSLASPETVASLNPGESTTVTLALTPAATLALQEYTGTIAVNGTATGVGIPYVFRAVSSAVGGLTVLVDDDFTFNAAGQPRVAGATVSLLDAYDNTKVIATATTDATGSATLSGVPAGPYVLQVTADGHSSYHASVTVGAGMTAQDEVYIARQLVTYNWVVQQTTVADSYQIQLQTSFQTDVPAPVVTLSTPASLPDLEPGQSGQFNITFTNHGLIAAEGLTVTLPTDPEYTFAALTTDLGALPAQSSVTVPVTVTRAASMAASATTAIPTTAPDVADDPLAASLSTTLAKAGVPVAYPAGEPAALSPLCTVFFAGVYHFECDGTHYVPVLAPAHVENRQCIAVAQVESLIEFTQSLFTNPIPGNGTPVKLISQPDQSGVPVPSLTVPNECNDCDLRRAQKLAEDALKFVAQPAWVKAFSALQGFGDAANKAAAAGGTSAGADLGALYKYIKAILAGSAALGTKVPYASVLKYLETAYDLLNACNQKAGGGSPVSPAIPPAENVVFDPEAIDVHTGGTTDNRVGQVQVEDERVVALFNAFTSAFGNPAWLQTDQTDTLEQFTAAFLADTADPAGNPQAITAAARSSLLAMSLPDSITADDANELVDRWNRTIAYWANGIFYESQVPAGQSTDFIALDELQGSYQAAADGLAADASEGYADPVTALGGAFDAVQTALTQSGTCATIKLQIDQTATLARSAFTGTLTLTNGMADDALTNVEVDLTVTDTAGNPVPGTFYISAPKLGGGLTAVDGTGTLPAGMTGTVEYEFIPTDSAAVNGATEYQIGGTLKYTDPDMGGAGTEVTTPMFPATITVYPQAKLQLNYFLQQDVVGDDPFTPQVEPSEPATLGLLVTNIGLGEADDLSIATAQPTIVENDKGALDTFTIVGTQVGDQAETPSLDVDFGDLAPGATGDASFLITSSLEGEFTNFSATFTHSDQLGGLDTSLIASVVTHTLIHAGNFAFANDNGATSYLAEDTINSGNLPDMLYLSDGTTAPVNVATDFASASAGTLAYTVTADVTSGWDYLQLPDPGAGYTLYKVVRSDGKTFDPDQAWTTDRTFDAAGHASVDYELHLLDDNSTGSYTVYYKPTTIGPVAVSAVGPVSTPQAGGVASVPVTFNEPIDPATFTLADVTLTLNGQPVTLSAAAGVSISQTSPMTFAVDGLAALTAGPGNYVLTVSAVGIGDPFGDVGAGSASATWATAMGNVPVVVTVGPENPSLRNTPLDTATVTLSEAIDPSTFDYRDLSLTLNGGTTNLIIPGVTVSRVADTTYQISGLAALTGADGTYTLTVNAGGLSDPAGDAGVGSASETWTKSSVAPTITTLQGGFQSPRNTVVPSIDVTFSEPVNPATFTYQDVTFAKAGGSNLIDDSLVITLVAETDDTKFQITGFNNLVSPIDGTYTFTVDTAGVTDLYGNVAAGTGTGGSASDTFVLQTTAPAAPTGLAINPDTGVSATDGLTDTGSITLTGSVAAGLTVEVYDGVAQQLAIVTPSGTTFSVALTLGPGAHDLRVDTVDAAGNVSADADLDVFVDTTPPTATFVPVVQATPRSAVTSATVTFAKAVDPSTLGPSDLSLTLNGGPNLITSAVTVNLVSGNTYEVDGLAGLDTAAGSYVLTLNLADVRDLAGNAGTAPATVDWTVLPAVSATTFGSLTGSQTVIAGTGPVVLSGTIGSETIVPAGETVAVTIDGRTVDAPVNAQGAFAASFDTSALPPSATPYTVTYAYAGDTYLSSATDASTTITVIAPTATVTLAGPPSPLVYDGTADVTAWAVATLAGNGPTAPTGSAVLVYYAGSAATGTPLASPPVNAGTYTVVATYAGDADYMATSSPAITFTVGRATPTVTIAQPPPTLMADGTADVTAWVTATVAGVVGAPAPSGRPTFVYYAGSAVVGTPLVAPPTTAGTYTVVAVYAGNSNYAAATSSPVTFTISPAAPGITIAGFVVNDGSAQRSMVDSLTLTFSAPVNLSAGAITLATAAGDAVPFTLTTPDGGRTWTLTFTGSQFIGGSLANGRYTLTVHAAGVTGQSGGALATDATYSFFRLFGDANGDGTVNNADLIAFKRAYNSKKGLAGYVPYFDYDGNGVIDADDLRRNSKPTSA